MARLEILHFPDPRLRNKAQPVHTVDDSVRRLVDDMFETMYDAPGIGLAAIQVNVPKRVITIDVSEDRSQPVALVNPEILESRGSLTTARRVVGLVLSLTISVPLVNYFLRPEPPLV